MLTAKDIYKYYARHPVLNGVSLQAEGGEIIGIAGINGSGKSTFLSVLTGILPPDAGLISLESSGITPASLRKWLGYVPQENALFENLSTLDNLKLWAAAYKVDWQLALPFLFPESETKTEKEEQLFLKKKAGKLSGGMKKRLSISLSLMHDPKYLIMDEPTAGLDIGFRWMLAQTVKQLRDRGKCVIFTSHQTDELLLCDRMYVLRDGLFIYEGSAQVLQNGTDALYALISGKTPKETVLC